MTNQQHPITPPPELVQQWWDGTHGAFYEFEAIAIQAARWGADAELEACVNYIDNNDLSAGAAYKLGVPLDGIATVQITY